MLADAGSPTDWQRLSCPFRQLYLETRSRLVTVQLDHTTMGPGRLRNDSKSEANATSFCAAVKRLEETFLRVFWNTRARVVDFDVNTIRPSLS